MKRRREHGAIRRARLFKTTGRGEDLFEYQLARLGLAYERQAQIGPYYADYLLKRYKLVIEIDGKSHLNRLEKDQRRDAYIEAQGYRVVRLLDDYAIKHGYNAALFALHSVLTPEEWAQYVTWRERELEAARAF